MAWFVRPLQLKDSGRWHLVASSDEDGGFHVCCRDHSHASADDVLDCGSARAIADQITGISSLPEEDDRDTEIKRLKQALRKSVEALMTVERCAPGYDWNTDPLYLTRIIGEVYQLPEWEKICNEDKNQPSEGDKR